MGVPVTKIMHPCSSTSYHQKRKPSLSSCFKWLTMAHLYESSSCVVYLSVSPGSAANTALKPPGRSWSQAFTRGNNRTFHHEDQYLRGASSPASGKLCRGGSAVSALNAVNYTTKAKLLGGSLSKLAPLTYIRSSYVKGHDRQPSRSHHGSSKRYNVQQSREMMQPPMNLGKRRTISSVGRI
jgi:hypothetical protein